MNKNRKLYKIEWCSLVAEKPQTLLSHIFSHKDQTDQLIVYDTCALLQENFTPLFVYHHSKRPLSNKKVKYFFKGLSTLVKSYKLT